MKTKLRLPKETITVIKTLGNPTTIVNCIYEWYDKQGELDIMTIPSSTVQSQECGWLTVDITSSLYYELCDNLSPRDNRCSPARLITYFIDNEFYEDELFGEIVNEYKTDITNNTQTYLSDLIVICNKLLSSNVDIKLLKIVQELLTYARQHT